MLNFQQKEKKMKNYFEILQKCSLFNEVSEEDLKNLLGCLGATVREYDKKQIIIDEGTTVRNIGIVLSGSAHITQIDYLGNRSIVSDVSVAEMFCEAFACAGVKEVPVSVVANESCEIMFVDCNRVMHSCCKACNFHTKIIYNLMKNMALKNVMFHQKIQITSKRTTREKLMEYLMQQAKLNNSNSFEIPFDRQELADFIEVERSGLSAEISKLRNEGILESRKNKFSLLAV